ncbi:VCBS repeat-containing protein [Cognatishimia sp. MH4019]|uniref:FG-GAP repeat domain-containing protein n=1 Tax=Cognatishimia sp. MH4019 TaxID=2854030 RepID=UPI001CD1BAF6|nr:VCBS repeat-containing protein [Cognatishimia sp. MH4019]
MRWAAFALALAASPAVAEITSARYTDPTTRYAHGVLGDAIEHETLEVTLSTGQTARVHWSDTVVFEDTEPRVVDVTGDGAPEVVVVEAHQDLGARLSVYHLADGTLTRLAETPFIGRTNRWLAPIGAADLDGDGAIEIAYIDRPHLAKTLRVWRFADGGLTEVATLAGLTNHRIGERDIAGGIRDCGQGPEMIVADAVWEQVVSVRMNGDGLSARPITPHQGRQSFSAAMACGE